MTVSGCCAVGRYLLSKLALWALLSWNMWFRWKAKYGIIIRPQHMVNGANNSCSIAPVLADVLEDHRSKFLVECNPAPYHDALFSPRASLHPTAIGMMFTLSSPNHNYAICHRNEILTSVREDFHGWHHQFWCFWAPFTDQWQSVKIWPLARRWQNRLKDLSWQWTVSAQMGLWWVPMVGLARFSCTLELILHVLSVQVAILTCACNP